jgi:hypothetical protein
MPSDAMKEGDAGRNDSATIHGVGEGGGVEVAAC